MKEILDAVENMRTGKDREFFANLYSFFLKVNSMSRDEIVSAYQALDFFQKRVLTKEERSRNFDVLSDIDNAIIARMIAITADTSPEDRFNVASLFWTVTTACITLRDSYVRAKALHERLHARV